MAPPAVRGKSSLRDASEDFARRQLFRWPVFADRKHFGLIALLLVVAEVAISFFIVNHRKCRCFLVFLNSVVVDVYFFLFFVYTDTEIDWRTYMQQVECFLSGELDYEAIKGDTGPIVYPAGHLYVYTLLYYLTGRGTDIYLGQCIFALLYLATVCLVFGLYARYSQVRDLKI